MTKYSCLATPSVTRAVLERFGLSTKKALGQHFLVNDDVVRRICELSEVNTDDTVVEIGPGIGTLTVALLARVQQVIAIERDADLPPVLRFTCANFAEKLTLLEKDALEVMPQDFPIEPQKLIANLPYAVAATLVLDYFERFASINQATVMVQSEVADRMCARPGTKNYGAYTVKLALFAQASGRFSVSEGNFFPPPRVKSAVVRLDRVAQPYSQQLTHATMLMADAAFENRRKTLVNSLRSYVARLEREGQPLVSEHQDSFLRAVLDRAGIDATRRGETLSFEEFLTLGQAYLEISEHMR